MSELPKGWELVSLLEYLGFLPTGVEKYTGKKNYFSTGSIQDSICTPEGLFNYQSRPSRANRIARFGDVFQARMKETNKGLLITESLAYQLFSTGFIQLRPFGNTYDNKLLFYFVRSRLFLDQRDELATGSTQEALTDSGAREIQIPFLPRNEQCRIVEKLDKLLAKVEASRKRLENIPRILKRFRQSVLAAACSGKLTEDWREENQGFQDASELIAAIMQERHQRFAKQLEINKAAGRSAPKPYDNYKPNLRSDSDLFDLPSTWQWVDLRFLMDESEPFCYGVVQPSVDDPNGQRMIRVCDLDKGTVRLVELRRIPQEVHRQYERSVVKGGELLVTVVGTIGRVALVPPECNGYNIARAIAKVPIRDFDRKYIMVWLSSSTAESWMVNDAREVARKTLNLEQLRTLPVPLPPLPEQHEIVHRVEQLFTLADNIEERYKKANAYVEKLTQSILAKAFRGELVPQDPNDPPASQLLEEIRKKKEAIRRKE